MASTPETEITSRPHLATRQPSDARLLAPIAHAPDPLAASVLRAIQKLALAIEGTDLSTYRAAQRSVATVRRRAKRIANLAGSLCGQLRGSETAPAILKSARGSILGKRVARQAIIDAWPAGWAALIRRGDDCGWQSVEIEDGGTHGAVLQAMLDTIDLPPGR